MRLIGDVHGKLDEYISLASQVDYSLQIGDLGFDYSKLSSLNPLNHRVIAGNHDNYNFLSPHFLGDYGLRVLDRVTFFFVRGALSVDKQYRVEGVSWWANEELTYGEGMGALEEYSKAKPNIVISHDCPQSIVGLVATNSMKLKGSLTNNLLQAMLEVHSPSFWFFGHHHIDWEGKVNDCLFRCLAELSYLDL